MSTQREEIDVATPGCWGSPGPLLWGARRHIDSIVRKTQQLAAAARPSVDMPDSGLDVVTELRRDLDRLERAFRECLDGRKPHEEGGDGA